MGPKFVSTLPKCNVILALAIVAEKSQRKNKIKKNKKKKMMKKKKKKNMKEMYDAFNC